MPTEEYLIISPIGNVIFSTSVRSTLNSVCYYLDLIKVEYTTETKSLIEERK